jgi:hypothetical protein
MRTVALRALGASCLVFAMACAAADDDPDIGSGGSVSESSNGGGASGGSPDGSGGDGAPASSAGTNGNASGGAAGEASASSGGDAGSSNTNSGGTTATGGGPGTGEADVMMGMTAAHNAVRAEVGVGPLTWSLDVAAYAQEWADVMASDCNFRHRTDGIYGENLAAFARTRSPPMTAPEAVVDAWAAEIACWTYGTFLRADACDASCATNLNSDGCGHYTQIVWEGSLRLGCGRSECIADNVYWEFWVCNYDPPGNRIGQYPYQ